MRLVVALILGFCLGALFSSRSEAPKEEQIGEKKEIAPIEPLSMLGSDLVALPYEHLGGVLSVPIVVEKAGESHELWMIFDTGASFSTINRATMLELGLELPDDAPIVRLRTANGVTEAPLLLIGDVWFGGYWVGPLTVALCESCASENVVGLLGLNLSSGFLMTLDPVREELLLQPRGPRQTKRELRHWISFSSRWGLGTLVIAAENKSQYPLQELELSLSCQPGRVLTLSDIGSKETKEGTIAVDACAGGTIDIVGGVWGRVDN